MNSVTLQVKGMSCGHCVQSVTAALQAVDGVRSVRVDLASGRAVVDYDDARTSPVALAAAVTEEGYSAEPIT